MRLALPFPLHHFDFPKLPPRAIREPGSSLSGLFGNPRLLAFGDYLIVACG